MWSGYRKSTRSEASGQCVEVAFSEAGRVRMRDSKLGEESPVLEFGGRGWREFLAGRPSAVAVTRRADGGAEVRDATVGAAGPVLVFTEAEWDAFQAGIAAGEFAPEVVPPELV